MPALFFPTKQAARTTTRQHLSRKRKLFQRINKRFWSFFRNILFPKQTLPREQPENIQQCFDVGGDPKIYDLQPHTD